LFMPPEGGARRTLVTPLSCEPALAHLDWWCDGRVCQTTASRREEPHCVSCVTCGRRKPTCVCRTRPALLLTVFLPATSSADSSILQHVHNQSLAPPCTSKPSKFFTRRLQQRRRNDFNFQHCGGESRPTHNALAEFLFIAAKKILPPWFQHCRGERPRRPRRSDASGLQYARSG